MFVNDFGKEFKTLEEARADILNELRKDDGYILLIGEDIDMYLVEVLRWIHENGLWERFRKDFEKPISDAEKSYIDTEITYFKEIS